MKTKTILTSLVLALIIMSSCTTPKTEKKEKVVAPKDDVITLAEQQKMTPDSVIKSLKKGNENYVNNKLTPRDYKDHIKKTSKGQYPEAVVLACIDSRVPVEQIFDKGIGDIFVARVAGNFVNEDILGSMEYACKVAGSKVILVLGHEYCGAVKSAVKQVKLGNITAMLSKIQPAIKNLKYDGKKDVKNKEYMAKVCESNVENTIKEIRLKSPILKEMEDKGQIKIVGGVYDLDNGKVEFLK